MPEIIDIPGVGPVEFPDSMSDADIKPFATDDDRSRAAITLDWSQTKAKQSQLFSQVRTAVASPWLPPAGGSRASRCIAPDRPPTRS